MKKVRKYWDVASDTDIEFFGLKRDKNGRAYYETETHTADEREKIAVEQSREARRETPDCIKVQLGLRV